MAKSGLQINTKGLKYNSPGDRRLLLFRWLSRNYEKGEGWKLSVSLHPYWFCWRRSWREFRLTILGLNIHFRRK